MGGVISKAANGIGGVIGSAFAAPIKTIFGASCEYAIDTMQSVCLKEAGVKASGSLEEETTLMGLTFGGYLRLKADEESIYQALSTAVGVLDSIEATIAKFFSKFQFSLVIINVDGATSENGKPSSIGVVIRDCRGCVVAARGKILPATYTAEVTEAFAIEEGVVLVCELKLSNVILESDSTVVVQALVSKSGCGDIGPIVQGAYAMLGSFSSWTARHLKRDYNRAAHDLAKIETVLFILTELRSMFELEDVFLEELELAIALVSTLLAKEESVQVHLIQAAKESRRGQDH